MTTFYWYKQLNKLLIFIMSITNIVGWWSSTSLMAVKNY